MRTVASEELFRVPALPRRIDAAAVSRRGLRKETLPESGPTALELLAEIGEQRLQSMDEAGITVQVLSNTGPGPDLVPGPEGIAMSREMNDHLAAAVARRPDRFAGFATLPMLVPDAAATELARAVKELGFRGALIDRKSTRLNSSHQIISYAVFCLKKKKTKEAAISEEYITVVRNCVLRV